MRTEKKAEREHGIIQSLDASTLHCIRVQHFSVTS